MKKLFPILFLISYFLFLISLPAFAISPTPKETVVPTNTVEEQINQLKDRIASRVAQLKLVERRGIIGNVTDVTDTQITLEEANSKIIDVDELTKFSSPSIKEGFGISDIGKGMDLGILGLYNKQSQRMLARFVNVVNQPKRIHGTVMSIDNKNYTLTVATENKTPTIVDVETITKTYSFTKESELARSGFSKIKKGQNIIAVGFYDIKNKTHIIASRIITFPEIPANPKIIIPQETPTPSNTLTPSPTAKKETLPTSNVKN